MKRIFLCCLALICTVLLLAGCGGSSKQEVAPAPAASTAAVAPEPAEYQDTGAGTQNSPSMQIPADGRKVIMTAQLSVETQRFSATCQNIESILAACNGYISASQIYEDSSSGLQGASFTLRVPAEQYSRFLSELGEAEYILSRSENSEDVTSVYVDLEARLKSLRTQETRLLELMAETTKLSDMIALEDKLTEVQYEIESITSQKNTYDQLISYSTVNIELREVAALSPEKADSYGQRLGQAFADGWTNFVGVLQDGSILLAYALPALLVLLLLGVLVLVPLLLASARRKKKRAAQKPEPPTPPPAL